MRTFASRLGWAACLALLPLVASAQTSGIAGEVRDTTGAGLSEVTVEVTSPALIERVRSALTDGSGRYSITNLRPGVYTVTFALSGFRSVIRENIELTSDFTATVSADLRVGTVEETIVVTADAPVVDVQSVTTRTIMTRDMLDSLPTGRNIQAVGIMIPGTSLALGGGGALSRDVGGSGSLQQSPLQYRGSGDTVQTIEGLRLNNLCAQGAFSGVYWNDASFQELSYVTGADSAEMGQGGIRVNMVPKDGGNSFMGAIQGNVADGTWAADNCGSSGPGLACSRENLTGDTTYNSRNYLTNVGSIKKVWDFNPSIGGPLVHDKVWFNYTFRYWGVSKTVSDSFGDRNPSPFVYDPDPSVLGVDDGHIVSHAGRLAWQVSRVDKVSVYHDNQRKDRNHWGINALVPPDASAIQVTPTSFVNVTKWSRTQTSRLLLEAGVGIYDQEYTEIYQPSVTGANQKVWDLAAIRNARVYTLCDTSNTTCTNPSGQRRIAAAWDNPGDHFSLLRTFSGSASYVTGSHNIRLGAALTNGDWRLARQWTGDVAPIEFTSGAATAVTLRLPYDRRNGIKADTGIYAQDRWTVGRAALNLGLRYDWFMGESKESDVLPSQFNSGVHFSKCPDGVNDASAGCVGRVQNWKDLSPRIGVAYDLFGDGRTAIKGSVARYVAGQQIAVADDINPVGALGLTDRRTWRDLDNNGLPINTATGAIQFNELTDSTSTPTFGRNIPTTAYDPAVLNGWFKRGFNWEYTLSAQHQLAVGTSINGGYFRRKFGNQTVTDDLRYDPSSYDGPFCINAPSNANLPGGGGYQVCGLYDLKQSVVDQRLPANQLVRFSDDFGGETNIYQGLDINIDQRFERGAFIRAGLQATSRTFDNCNLAKGGYDVQTLAVTQTHETYTDGTTYCHREYPFRPDAKVLGSYTLPLDIMLSGTYQFTRGVQTGGNGPSILATYTLARTAFADPAVSNKGSALNTAVATKSVQLMREGLDYGDENLHQLDLRASKRFQFNRYRIRFDFDVYNVLNSSWPYTVTTAFSTAATSAYLRPTNVLQSRFFKIGGQFDF
jgi:hypothetical protein